MNLDHPPFIILPRALAAISDYPGNMTDRQVLACLAQFANEKGEAWPTERYIATCLNMEQDDVHRSLHRLAAHGLIVISKAMKRNDKHPRNVYTFPRQCVRSTPDPMSKRYADAVKKKQAAEMASQQAATPQAAQAVTMTPAQAIPAAPAVQLTTQDTTPTTQAAQPASASPSQPVQLTPSQASQERQKRGGGVATFGSVLSGLFGATPAAAATPAVKDTYEPDLSDEPLPDYYQQQEAATATAEHTWRDNVPAEYRHETATVTGPTTTAADEWDATAPVQPGPAIQQPTPQPTADEWDTWPEADEWAEVPTADEWDTWDTWKPDKWEEACQQAAQDLASIPWPEEDPWPEADDWEAWAQFDEWEAAQPIPAA